MKKLLYVACCLGLLAFVASGANAGINFIVQPSKGSNSTNTHIPQTHTCLRSGYKLRSCPAGSFPNKRCPDNATFYDKCCDGKIYKYSSSGVCVNAGMIPQGECGGKYSCANP